MRSTFGSNHDNLCGAAASRISVVIPAYNASAHVAATLRSVVAQSAPPAEIIVVDDGSTDDTAAIARAFGVRVMSQGNRGLSAARNAGTRAATGDYIAYLDADDLWTPDKLAVQFAALASYGEPAFSFTDYRIFDPWGMRSRTSELRFDRAFRRAKATPLGDNLLIAANPTSPVMSDCYILPSSVLVRRADVLAVGGFDETVIAAEDYELFLRLFNIIPAVAVLQPLLLYRRHAQQATQNTTKMKTGLLDVARRVAAAPERYPSSDVRHFARTDFLRHHQLGLAHARVGRFAEAVESFERGLASRRSTRTSLALFAARLCGTTSGRHAFNAVKRLWKARPTARPLNRTEVAGSGNTV